MKPFKSLFSDFLIIKDNQDEPLHILYMKTTNFQNPKNSYNFISLLKKLKLSDDKIIELLSLRFGFESSDSRSELNDWYRIYESNIRINKVDITDISIIEENTENIEAMEENHSQDDKKLFDQEVDEDEENFEIPAFLRRQKF